MRRKTQDPSGKEKMVESQGHIIMLARTMYSQPILQQDIQVELVLMNFIKEFHI